MYAGGTIPEVQVRQFVVLGCGYGYRYNIPVPTRNLCIFCKTSTPVPGIHRPCRTPLFSLQFSMHTRITVSFFGVSRMREKASLLQYMTTRTQLE